VLTYVKVSCSNLIHPTDTDGVVDPVVAMYENAGGELLEQTDKQKNNRNPTFNKVIKIPANQFQENVELNFMTYHAVAKKTPINIGGVCVAIADLVQVSASLERPLLAHQEDDQDVAIHDAFQKRLDDAGTKIRITVSQTPF